jgi:molybdopterin converting factor small subunit
MDKSQRHGIGDRRFGEPISEKVSILLFAGAAQAIAIREVKLDTELPTTIAALADRLSNVYPPLESIVKRSRFAVNDQFVDNEFVITDSTSEIALIPPVSGG